MGGNLLEDAAPGAPATTGSGWTTGRIIALALRARHPRAGFHPSVVLLSYDARPPPGSGPEPNVTGQRA